MKKIVFVLGLSLIGACSFAKELATGKGLGYGSSKGKITEKDFSEAVDSLGEQGQMIKTNNRVRIQFLNHMIDTQLLSEEALKSGLEKDPKFLKRLEMTKQELLARAYVDKKIADATTDKALEAYFNSHKNEFSDEKVRASHILFKESDKAKAEKVLKEAMKADDKQFAELAKKHSTGPSASRGGDLNYFGRGRMVPAFDKAVFAAKKGETVDHLVKTQFGYHIIRVTDIKSAKDVTFASKKMQVKQVVEKKTKDQTVAELREKSGVKVNDKNLETMKLN